jgi:hypothetical protein
MIEAIEAAQLNNIKMSYPAFPDESFPGLSRVE